MKAFLLIAGRNVLRNKGRSWITIFSIGFGLGAMLFIWGFIDGAHLQLKENFTGLFMGHLQVHGRGFEKTMKVGLAIRDPRPVESLLAGQKEVAAFTRRIRTFAFFRSGENSLGGLLVGIDPLGEPRVSKIKDTVRQGRFLGPPDQGGIVLGDLLAGNLKVSLQDRVLAMVQSADGILKTAPFRVIGIIKTGVEEMDRMMAFVSLEDSRNLLGLGQGVTDLVVRVRNLKGLDGPARSLKKESAHLNLEILTWSEMAPILQQWMDFDEAFGYIFLLIVLVVIVAGILNTILMSSLERTREFGVMLALGTKNYQLAFMLGLEAVFLGLSGLAVGLILGLSSVGIFSRVGVPLGSGVKEAMASFFISDVIYPFLEWEHVFSNGLVVFISCLLISLYPAWKVSRLRPVKALQGG